jgi:GxxExxY protein
MISPQRTQRNTEENLNAISGQVVDAAMRVHSALGPGLLESAYEACLKHELTKRGLKVVSQLELPIIYDDVRLDVGYRLDLLVENEIVVELKSIEKLLPIHEAQLLSYLKLSNRQIGILLNFNTIHLKEGITRIVNNYGVPQRSSASSAVK